MLLSLAVGAELWTLLSSSSASSSTSYGFHSIHHAAKTPFFVYNRVLLISFSLFFPCYLCLTSRVVSLYPSQFFLSPRFVRRELFRSSFSVNPIFLCFSHTSCPYTSLSGEVVRDSFFSLFCGVVVSCLLYCGVFFCGLLISL